MNRYTFAADIVGQIDAESGVISGVSVITEGPALGHGVMIDSQSLSTVQECAMQYKGGLKVKMNHGSGAEAILGTLRDFRIDGIQLRADLHLLRNHPMRALVLEMAQEMPDTFGLSISFSGQVEERSGEMFVRCLEIYSCDIVDQPAANPTGLFSRVDMQEQAMSEHTVTASIALDASAFNAGLAEAGQNLEAFVAKLTAAQSQAQINFQNLQSVTAERDDLKAQLSARAGEITNLQAQLNQAAQDFEAYKAGETERLNAEAARIVAANGHKPMAVTGEDNPATQKADNTLSRAEFRALSARKQNEFITKGGKLID